MFFVKVKGKTGGSRPAIRLTFFNAKKVSKKAGSWRRAYSFASFLSFLSTEVLLFRPYSGGPNGCDS
jgi:hypothetical protein